MIPPIVLGAKPGDLVLDMCASPGSKATQIAQMLQGQGFLVANDYKGARLAPLGLNLQRLGASNCMTTLSMGDRIKSMQFDRILVDAPCSGTGTIRKSLKTLMIWNPNMVRRLAGTQKQLLKNAFDLLKPGGTIVYSTCSCEPEENEAVVSELLESYPEAEIKEIEINIERSDPIQEFNGKTYNQEVKKALRIWPQDNDTEGFFVAKIRKNQEP